MKQKRTINLHYGDMTDSSSLIRIIQQVQPDEIYNLAAQSHVKVSFDVRNTPQRQMPSARCVCWKLSASSAWRKRQRFTKPPLRNFMVKYRKSPNRETTPFYPRSPYGVAKQYGFWITKNYRESYGMFAVNGILFNHESERRGETFVTRKITLAAARMPKVSRTNCIWVIWMHVATGDMRKIMWNVCG